MRQVGQPGGIFRATAHPACNREVRAHGRHARRLAPCQSAAEARGRQNGTAARPGKQQSEQASKRHSKQAGMPTCHGRVAPAPRCTRSWRSRAHCTPSQPLPRRSSRRAARRRPRRLRPPQPPPPLPAEQPGGLPWRRARWRRRWRPAGRGRQTRRWRRRAAARRRGLPRWAAPGRHPGCRASSGRWRGRRWTRRQYLRGGEQRGRAGGVEGVFKGWC